MATLASLRKQAKDLGVPRDFILKASSSTLQSMIEDAQAHENGATAKPRKKSATKKSAARKATTEQPKRRGRPPGSKNKPKTVETISKSASAKSKPAAKSTQGKAKRSTAVTATKKATKTDALVTRNYTKKPVEKDDGRYTLSQIDYSDTQDWNPRPGSVPDQIQRLLKRFRGNRTKVFLAVYEGGDLWNFVGKKKQDGSKRTEAEGIAMLKYRIARTDWDFALKTGQHEKSENRIEYGTGENATVRAKKPTKKKTTAKAKPKAKAASKAVAKKPVKKTATKTVRKPVRRRVTARKASSARK